MKRLRSTPRFVLTALAIACVAIVACSLDSRPCAPGDLTSCERVCAPGDYRYCDCPSAKQGYEQCAGDGTGYGACDCSGNVPPGAGILVEAGATDATDAAADTGLLGFLAPCVNDTDCATHLCFAFNAFGPHCSHACAKDTDCEPPSPGCSGKQVCKLH